MAIPTFVSAGTRITGLTAITVPWGTGHQADDIGVLFVQTANQPIATPSGWSTFGASSSQGSGTGGAAGSVAIQVFWKRATSGTEADVSLPDSGDHTQGRIFVFRGCETSGNPYNLVAGNIKSLSSDIAIPGGTTTVNDCLAVGVVANAVDDPSNQTTAGTFTNGTLSSVTRLGTGNSSSGVGGGYDVMSGGMATAGVIATTTGVLAGNSVMANVLIALMPPQVAPPSTPTNGGVYVATGIKSTAGATGTTVATMDASSAQARLVIALKSQSVAGDLPPIFPAIGDAIILASQPFIISLNAVDPEGAVVDYTLQAGATAVPAGAAIVTDPEDGSKSFQWTPAITQIGDWDISIIASDQTGHTTEQSFGLTVALGQTDATTALQVADRAHTDLTVALTLAQLLLDRDQYNAAVWQKILELKDDTDAATTYMQSVIDSLAPGEQT